MAELDQKVASLEKLMNKLESHQVIAKPREESAPETVVIAPEAKRPERDPQKLTKKDIQRVLRSGGYYRGAIDGKIGPKTRRAIKRFQRTHGLKTDGVAGKRTKRALVQYIDW